ncbi:MAG: hypothetical protein P1U56_17275 [Saprospiraceae bacterium]|nr:hypothetical protein [Saprospiraceae bacterium]
MQISSLRRILICSLLVLTGVWILVRSFIRLQARMDIFLEFIPITYESIYTDILFGLFLLITAAVSIRPSKPVLEITLLTLSIPVFAQVDYFIYVGFIFWILLFLIMISSIPLGYKVLVVFLLQLYLNDHLIALLSIYNILELVGYFLLLLNIGWSKYTFKEWMSYKMEWKYRLLFFIVLLPNIISHIFH